MISYYSRNRKLVHVHNLDFTLSNFITYHCLFLTLPWSILKYFPILPGSLLSQCTYIHDGSFSSLSYFTWLISTNSSQLTIANICSRNLAELQSLCWVLHFFPPIHWFISVRTLKASSGNYQLVCLPIFEYKLFEDKDYKSNLWIS